jgi:hypothetical protein
MPAGEESMVIALGILCSEQLMSYGARRPTPVMMISTRTHLFMNSKASRQSDDSLGDFGEEGKKR